MHLRKSVKVIFYTRWYILTSWFLFQKSINFSLILFSSPFQQRFPFASLTLPCSQNTFHVFHFFFSGVLCTHCKLWDQPGVALHCSALHSTILHDFIWIKNSSYELVIFAEQASVLHKNKSFVFSTKIHFFACSGFL